MRRQNRIAVPPRWLEHVRTERHFQFQRAGDFSGLAVPDIVQRIGERRADYVGGEVALPGDERDENRWFNTSAFAAAPDTRFGNAEVGQIVGPGRHAWDLSFRKHFGIGATKLGVQADVFNLFNTVNLNAPNVVTTSADFGKINGAGPPRQVQLGIRLEF